MRVVSLSAIMAFFMLSIPAQGSDSNGTYRVLGAGTVSCTKYLNATPRQRQFAETWWAGYVTAMNQSTKDTYNLIGGSPTRQVTAWLVSYCKRNPNHQFARAVHSMLKAAYPNRYRRAR